MSGELVTWLRAQLDEDERVARAAGGKWGNGLPATIHPNPTVFRTVTRGAGVVCGSILSEDAEHIARHDPARVLREVAAKRAVVELLAHDAPHSVVTGQAQREDFRDGWQFAVRDALCLLALPYASHPGYRPEWAPPEERVS
jgi:hypothetical protein